MDPLAEHRTSSFALERADSELSLGAWRTGLLTHDVVLVRLRLPTFFRQWHMQSRNRRLQLRGSGGFSPRFPNIAPAELRLRRCATGLYYSPPLFIPAFAETKT